MHEKYFFRYLRLIAMTLAVLLALQAAPWAPMRAGAASSSEIQEQIDELKEKEKELEARLQELDGQIAENMGEMERLVAQKRVLDQEIFLLNEQVTNINQQIQAYGLLIADKQDELDIAQERYDRLADQSLERIRAMEMYGELSYLSVLAQAGSFGEFLDRLSMVFEIARADSRRLDELDAAAQVVIEAKGALETEKLTLEDIRLKLEQTQQEILTKRAQADQLLQVLIARGEEYDRLVEQGELESQAILEQIAQAEIDLSEAQKAEYEAWLATSVPPTTAASGVGSQMPPSQTVDGVVWTMPINYLFFSSPYGMRDHPIDGVPKFHHGVDLAAPEGTPIYAARSGVVTVATYSNSAGWFVTINHGDGFSTTYMHMTHYTVSVGQCVAAGQKIGECGNTGASKGNHLHFGIYYNGASVNPANYISFY